jgi:hypothetical protein
VLQNPQEDKYQTLKLRNAVVGKMLAVTGFLVCFPSDQEAFG